MSTEVTKKVIPSLFGSIKEIPQVDTTLTKEGRSADAKVVGDILADHKRRIDNIDPHTAENVGYDNTVSGLNATDVKGALDELMLGKAPSGYGLGTHAKGLVNIDLNDVTEVGFYCFDTGVGVVNAPTTLPSILNVKPFYNANYVEQECILLDGIGTRARRVRHNGVWQPWEYENPPMTLWEEYRTTEKWMGIPVYTKLISYTPSNDIGNAGGTYGFAIEFSTPHFKDLIRFSGSINMESGNVFPSVNTDGGYLGVNFMNSGGIALAINKKIIPANTNIYLQLWYTKFNN